MAQDGPEAASQLMTAFSYILITKMTPYQEELWYAPKDLGIFRDTDWEDYRYAKYYLYR